MGLLRCRVLETVDVLITRDACHTANAQASPPKLSKVHPALTTADIFNSALLRVLLGVLQRSTARQLQRQSPAAEMCNSNSDAKNTVIARMV